MPTTTQLTGSGSWTVPTGVVSVTVECIGGGAGSWYANQSGSGSAALYGGCGGGAYSKRVLTVTPGGSVSYSVGAAGLAGTSGTTATGGGTSWFKSNDSNGCVALGGQTSSGGAGAAGGGTAGSYGDTVFRGGNGATSNGSSNSGGGGGGAGPGGQGGDASGSSTTAGTGQTPGGSGGAGSPGGANNSHPGSNYGGGAGGACCGFLSTQNGAAGGIGWMQITYILPVIETVSDSTWSGSEDYRLSLVPADTATTSEAVSKLANAAAEAITAAESALILQFPAPDTMFSVDSAGSGLLIAASDGIGSISDSVMVGPAVSDSSTASDSFTNPLLNEALDQISAADLSALVFGLADTAAASESALKKVGVNTPAQDTASTSETVQIGFLIPVSDSISAADGVIGTKIQGLDAFSAADIAITKIVKYASDDATTAEIADTELFFAAADTFFGTESAQIGLPKGVSDAFSASESAVLTILAPEPVIFADSVRFRLGKLIGERVFYVQPEKRSYLVPDES